MNVPAISLALDNVHSGAFNWKDSVVYGYRVRSPPNPFEDILRPDGGTVQVNIYLYFPPSGFRDMPRTIVPLSGRGYASGAFG